MHTGWFYERRWAEMNIASGTEMNILEWQNGQCVD
jgi:hypothetical protein